MKKDTIMAAVMAEKKIKPTVLARLMGLPVYRITDWKSGRTRLKPEDAPGVAKFLGVSAEYLLGLQPMGHSFGAVADEIAAVLARIEALEARLDPAATDPPNDSEAIPDLTPEELAMLKEIRARPNHQALVAEIRASLHREKPDQDKAGAGSRGSEIAKRVVGR